MIDHYLKTFSSLRSDTSRARWPEATRFRAPQKPLLLLAVMQTLSGRGIIGPAEQALWPELESLHWHQQNIFRKY